MLGHCTGRLVEGDRGIRPESKFDAEKVFTACRDHGTAVEINSRPERRDPPTRLLQLALGDRLRLLASTPTRTRPGQLDFLGYGAQRALDNGVPVERIVNTWRGAEELLDVGSVLIRQHRHLQSGIATRPARPGSAPRCRSDAAHGRPRCPWPSGRAADVERQLQLLGAVAVDVGHRETRPA